MWLFTTTGFYTVVQHKETKQLMIRGRVKKDMTDLKEKYMPEMSKIEYHDDYDYPYRSMISYEAYANGMTKIINDIDYGNFKSTITKKQGMKRSNIYMSIWSKLMNLEADPHRRDKYFARNMGNYDEIDQDVFDDHWMDKYRIPSNNSKL